MAYSMSQYLTKKKNNGDIDFIQTGNRKFLLYDIKNGGNFKTIFYDNKYREDEVYIDKRINRLNKELKNLSYSLDDIGLYNSTQEYNKVKKELNFIKKYDKK